MLPAWGNSLGVTKQLSLPAVSIRSQPTLGCPGTVNFPWSYVGRQVTQMITVLSTLTLTSPSHSWVILIKSLLRAVLQRRLFRGTVGCSLICTYLPNINGLSVSKPLTAVLSIPLADHVSFLTVLFVFIVPCSGPVFVSKASKLQGLYQYSCLSLHVNNGELEQKPIQDPGNFLQSSKEFGASL